MEPPAWCAGGWPPRPIIDTASPFVVLEVDQSQAPFTYRPALFTLRTSTFSASCNRGSATAPGQSTGWARDVQGTVANHGKLIVGEQVTQDGSKRSWRLTR